MIAWERSVFRPAAIAAMAGCVALALVELGSLVDPSWHGGYLVVISVLAALEACYSYILVQRRRLRGADALRFRAMEIALLLVFVKIGGLVGTDSSTLIAEIRRWPSSPESIVGMGDVFAAVLVLTVWVAATATMRDLDRLAEPLELWRDSARFVRSVTSRFFWGGVVLMIAAGLARIGIAALLELQRPPVPRLVANVLAYFLIGLAMIGQMHLTRLRNRWKSQGIDASAIPGRRWVQYSAVLIGVAVLLAVLIPIGYAGGLLESGATVVNAILYVLTVASWLISTLISYIIWLVSGFFQSLLGRDTPGRPRLQPLPRQTVIPRVGVPLIIPGWLEVLRTAVFWAVTLAMVGYVVWSYLRDHPEILEAIKRLQIVTAVRALLAQLRRRLSAAITAVSQLSVGASSDREPGELGKPRPRLRPRTPRERILHYYYSMLRRASRLGIPRLSDQTPLEYRSVLNHRLPEVQVELAQLTATFLEARYSRHDLGREPERQARQQWQAVKRALTVLARESEAQSQRPDDGGNARQGAIDRP